MIMVLLGPPGVGKGTQAVRLADELDGAHVSTGDLLRAARREGTPLGTQAQKYMDAGELVPDHLILDLVKEHLSGIAPDAHVLFDGFPRTTAQATGLEQVLKASGRQVDRVVLFEAPDETIVKRLSGRRSCPGLRASSSRTTARSSTSAARRTGQPISSRPRNRSSRRWSASPSTRACSKARNRRSRRSLRRACRRRPIRD